jgi:hypothetical protein
MADLLNLPNCGGSTGTFNSGFPLCDVIRAAPRALLLLDAGVGFDAADRASVATLVTAIKTATRAARGSRVYPIMSISNFDDTSTAATKAAIGNLSIQQITMQEGVPSFDFQHRKGEMYHKQLSKAENSNLTLMIIDDNYVIYGTQTAGGLFTGFSLAEFKAQLAKFANASTPSNYPFSVVLNDIAEYKENLAFVQLDSTVMNISGNVDTVLALVSQATNVANISATAAGGKSLGDNYSTEIADIDAWKATNAQTGADFTITSVTYNSTAKYFVVTLDSTAFTALTTGDKVNIDLVDVAALKALGVDGFESTGPVQVAKS